MHKTSSNLSGKTVKIKTEANQIGGFNIRIEDWWDRVYGASWMMAQGNPACLQYAVRTGFSQMDIPTDNEVLYGKIDGLGFLVHINELETECTNLS